MDKNHNSGINIFRVIPLCQFSEVTHVFRGTPNPSVKNVSYFLKSSFIYFANLGPGVYVNHVGEANAFFRLALLQGIVISLRPWSLKI